MVANKLDSIKKWGKRIGVTTLSLVVITGASVHGLLYARGLPELRESDFPNIEVTKKECIFNIKDAKENIPPFESMGYQEVIKYVDSPKKAFQYSVWLDNRVNEIGADQKKYHFPTTINPIQYGIEAGFLSQTFEKIHNGAVDGTLEGIGCIARTVVPCALLQDDGFIPAALGLANESYFQEGHSVMVYKSNGKFGAIGNSLEFRPPMYGSIDDLFPNREKHRVHDLRERNLVSGTGIPYDGIVEHLQIFYNPKF